MSSSIGPSIAFFWDPSLSKNSHVYTPSSSSLTSSPHYNSLHLPLLENVSSKSTSIDSSLTPNVVADNIALILPQCSAVYSYSSAKDLIQQIYLISKLLTKVSLDTSPAAPKSVPPFLFFISFEATKLEDYLPLVRFISFLSSHLPAVVTVLLDTKKLPNASTSGISSLPSSSSSAPSSVSSHNFTTSKTNAPVLNDYFSHTITPTHIYHILKTCGISSLSPPALSSSTLNSILDTASQFTLATKKVVDLILSSVENLSKISDFNPGALFSKKFDYSIVNFITYLEIYHHYHLLESDAKFSTLSSSPSESESESESFDLNQYPEIFHISKDRVDYITALVGDWDFKAHDLTYNDLLFAAFLMFKHAFNMQNLPTQKATPSKKKHSNSEKSSINNNNNNQTEDIEDDTVTVSELVISDVKLYKFLLVVRDSYRPSNPYHNFRHAIDVLQASFYFLIKLNSLPIYPIANSATHQPEFAPNTVSILDPVEALTLLVIAIGHDVGHPGVTNLFLSNAKTPIAEVFDFKSILESYHSAAFQRILEMYWPSTQSISVCRLIIKSVQATDMGLHFDYMKRAEKTFEMLHERSAEAYLSELEDLIAKSEKEKSSSTTTIVNGGKSCTNRKQEKLEFQTLVCCLLIKCADISNVVRTLEISSKWGVVLTKEFAQVETLEISLEMKPPKVVSTPSSSKTINNNEKTIGTSNNNNNTSDSRNDDDNNKSGVPVDGATEIEVEEDGEGYKVPVLALAKGQLFFIGTFARPLFELVSKLFPQLSYTMEILEYNAITWKKKLERLEEKEKTQQQPKS